MPEMYKVCYMCTVVVEFQVTGGKTTLFIWKGPYFPLKPGLFARPCKMDHVAFNELNHRFGEWDGDIYEEM